MLVVSFFFMISSFGYYQYKSPSCLRSRGDETHPYRPKNGNTKILSKTHGLTVPHVSKERDVKKRIQIRILPGF